MLKYGKLSILGICLLTFGLITGNIAPFLQDTQAAPGNCAAVISSFPPQVDSAQANQALNELNTLRASVVLTGTGGAAALSPVSQNPANPASGAGAQNHATYLANVPLDFPNSFESNPACATNVGNTAARYAARFGNASSLSNAVDLAMNSVFLRLPLLDPRLQYVGLGFDSSFGVIDTSNGSSPNYYPNNTLPNLSLTNYIVGYPGTSATGVPLTSSSIFLPGEGITTTSAVQFPRLAGGIITGTTGVGDYGDPVNGGNIASTNLGYPISLQFDSSYGNVSVDPNNSSLFKTSTSPVTPVPFIVKQPSQVAAVYNSLYAGTNTPAPLAAVMIPVNALEANSTYKVTFNYTGSGSTTGPQSISWSFTTGSGPVNPSGTGTPSVSGTPVSGGGNGPFVCPTLADGTASCTTTGAGSTTPTPNTSPTVAVPTPTPTPKLPGIPTAPSNTGPTSFYRPVAANGYNPPEFFQIWQRVDDPVKNSLVNRSWMFGPLPFGFAILIENYGGDTRVVIYHDKARMELTNPETSYVTNGLLVREMISGKLQLGDDAYDIRVPSTQSVVGDPAEVNPTAPTYASFTKKASLNNDNRSNPRPNQQVVEIIGRDGTVGTNNSMGTYGVTYSYYEPTLGHNIASRFWEYMNQVGLVKDGTYKSDKIFEWTAVMGLPLSEPYWTQAVVNGQLKDVLVQVFERRVMTYTPSNASASQVEMGNAGRSYYKWRYGEN